MNVSMKDMFNESSIQIWNFEIRAVILFLWAKKVEPHFSSVAVNWSVVQLTNHFHCRQLQNDIRCSRKDTWLLKITRMECNCINEWIHTSRQTTFSSIFFRTWEWLSQVEWQCFQAGIYKFVPCYNKSLNKLCDYIKNISIVFPV